jgi:Rhs element Vgr protein
MSDTAPLAAEATPDVCTFVLRAGGEDVSGRYHLLSLEVVRELNRIPAATIELRDGDPAQATFGASSATHFVPGQQIDIELGYRASNARVFRGVVVRHSLRIRRNASTLVLECRDAAVRMSTGRQSRQYFNRKDSDIIDEIAGAHKLERDVEDSGPALEEVVQYDATDWDFVVCRAEANGQVVAVEDGRLRVLRPRPDQEPAVTLAFGRTLLELDAEIDARDQSHAVRTASWSAAGQALEQADAREPRVSGGGNLKADALADVAAGAARVLRHGGALSQPELQAWADARLLRERLAKVRGRARCQGFSAARPGMVAELRGVGTRFEGALYVSGVRHRVAGGSWETDLQLGLDPRQFAQAFALAPPPAAGLLPCVAGLQVGVVTALAGDPGHEERIAVRLPFVTNSSEGLWARIASFDAGAQRGALFRPEIGDEVLLGFLDNDPRHPVVLGCLHSSAQPAPFPADDANPRKGYVSREGMRLVLDDGNKSMTLETANGNRIVLSEEARGIALRDQNGNKITLDAGGIVVESARDLVLKAAGDVRLEGNNVALNAQARLKAAGAAGAELSSGSNTRVEGGATVVVKGGMIQIN